MKLNQEQKDIIKEMNKLTPIQQKEVMQYFNGYY